MLKKFYKIALVTLIIFACFTNSAFADPSTTSAGSSIASTTSEDPVVSTAMKDSVVLTTNADQVAPSTNGYLSDAVGDDTPEQDIVAISWNINKKNTVLNLYTYRLSNEGDWIYSIDLFGDLNPVHADVECKCITDENGEVLESTQKITLYDATTGDYLWSSTSQWFLGPVSYVQIPLTYIVSSTVSGYEFNFLVTSNTDISPDSGYIKISTVPIYPYYFNFVLLIFPFLGILFYKYKKSNYKKLRS